MQVELAEARALQSDIYIRPPVEKYSSYAFSDIDELILKGEEATEKVIPKIKQMIGMWEES